MAEIPDTIWAAPALPAGDPVVRRRVTRDRGFTLIEMIVVLVVLALVGSIVLARGPMRSAVLDLRAAARAVASDMRSTRSRSIDIDRDLVFTIDPTAHDYGQRGGLRHGLPAAISVRTPAVPIVFHPDGSSSGGAITLIEADRALVVSVDWLTGSVSVR